MKDTLFCFHTAKLEIAIKYNLENTMAYSLTFLEEKKKTQTKTAQKHPQKY